MKRLNITSGEAWADHPEAVDIAEAEAVIEEPRLIRLLAFWLSRRNAGRPPARGDIDPRALGAELLPQIVMFECVERDGRPDCRYRLVGTALVGRLGIDPTGRYMSEVMTDPRHAEQLIRMTHLPLRTGLPVFSRGVHVSPDEQLPRRSTRRLTMPLQPLADGTALVLAGQVHVSAAEHQPTTAEMRPVYRSTRFVAFTASPR